MLYDNIIVSQNTGLEVTLEIILFLLPAMGRDTLH